MGNVEAVHLVDEVEEVPLYMRNNQPEVNKLCGKAIMCGEAMIKYKN